MDWEKYPISRKSIRMKQPKILESKTFHTFPEMGGGTFVKHFELDLPGLIFASSQVRVKGFK
jgi:hypothetical protein